MDEESDKVLRGLRRVTEEEANWPMHDVPDPPDAQRDAAEMKRQLAEEQEHGHPAWRETDDG